MPKLSYSLHKYNSAVGRFIVEAQAGLQKTDPILGQIQTHSVAHGGTTRQVSEPQVLETEMQLISIDTEADFEWFQKTDVEKFIEFLCELYESFNAQLKRHFFEVLSQTTEVTGNTFDASGRNIWDATLEMVAGMKMVFDENGNHNYSFCLHPNTYKKLMENPPTPEQDRKMEELIKNKREEYYAQKRTRRLS